MSKNTWQNEQLLPSSWFAFTGIGWVFILFYFRTQRENNKKNPFGRARVRSNGQRNFNTALWRTPFYARFAIVVPLHLVHGTPSPKTRQKNSAPESRSVGLQDVDTELPPSLQHFSLDMRTANRSLHRPFLPIDPQHMPPVTGRKSEYNGNRYDARRRLMSSVSFDHPPSFLGPYKIQTGRGEGLFTWLPRKRFIGSVLRETWRVVWETRVFRTK